MHKKINFLLTVIHWLGFDFEGHVLRHLHFNQKKPILALQNQSDKVTNPFVPNAPFLYPMKKSETVTVSLCFQEVMKGFIGNKLGKV